MSKKTLVVTYLPSGERSSTKQLVDAFLAAAKGKTAVEQCIGQDFRLQSAGLDRLAVSRCRRHGVAGLERLVGVRNQPGILWGCGEGRAGDRRACGKKRGTNRRKND